MFDNGIGLPENFNVEKAGSLGMKLIESLAIQLRAEFQFTSDSGTYFQIKIRC